MTSYPKEQLEELYKNLPKELQDALYSQENANKIQIICERNNIKDTLTVSKNIGFTLFGLLTPKDLSNILKEELKIDDIASKKLAEDITLEIFNPIKSTLESLYKTKLEIPEKKEEYSYREPIN